MRRSAYELGVDAGKRSLWFHKTLDRYLRDGLVAPEDRLDFYRGYWKDLFEVVYRNGRITMVNRN